MKTAIVLAACAFLVQSYLPAAEPPAQPSAEAEIATQFEAAAPALFHAWLDTRAESLRARELGQEAMDADENPVPDCFQFISCQDRQVPAKYSIDVRKTDSLITPFVGTIIVPTDATCRIKMLKSGLKTREGDRIASACIGHTYDECVRSGAKSPMSFSVFKRGRCGELDDFRFPSQHDIRLNYAWRSGKWEFQDETGAGPSPPSRK